MTLLAALLLLAVAAANGQSSYERIYGYLPYSQVTDHNAIDLDQWAMEVQLNGHMPTGMTNAKAIYMQGGNSKVYAEFTGTSAASYTRAGRCAATLNDGTASGPMSLKSAVTSGAGATFKCLYPTTAVQATYQACRVGGLQTTTTTGCVNPAQTITITRQASRRRPSRAALPRSQTRRGAPSRASRRCSTVTSKMYSGCAGCPYNTFMQFYNYYGDLDYADKWVLAALDGTSLTYTNGQAADFSSTTGSSMYTRVDAVKRATPPMNVWMYVIREFEDAVDDCSTSSIDNNYDAQHAWDEGVAFYTGSLEGTDGSGSGKMIAALADKRCQNFRTCGGTGTAFTGTAKANIDFFALSAEARSYLHNGHCSLVRPVLTEVIKKMTIPLLQGVLRYAYKVATNGPGGSNANRRLEHPPQGECAGRRLCGVGPSARPHRILDRGDDDLQQHEDWLVLPQQDGRQECRRERATQPRHHLRRDWRALDGWRPRDNK